MCLIFPNPQMLHADGSLQHSQTLSLSIIEGSFLKMASIVWVMGFPTVQAILRRVADAAILKAGVYAIGSSFLECVIVGIDAG